MTKNLPDSDSIIRHVRSQRLRRDEDDNVVGCLPHAFQRRAEENSLSVTWLEYFQGNKTQQLNAAINAIRSSLDVSPKSGFAIANVGKFKSLCTTAQHKVRIVHEPTRNNPAHSGIRQLPSEEMELLELLAAEAVGEVLIASSFPLVEVSATPELEKSE